MHRPSLLTLLVLIPLFLVSPHLLARGGHGGWGGGHGGYGHGGYGHGGWGGHPGWGHHPGWGRHGYWGGYWRGGWGWPYYGYGIGWGFGYPGMGYGFGIGYPWYGYGMTYGYPQVQQTYPSTYYSDPSLGGTTADHPTQAHAAPSYPKVWHYCPESQGYYPKVTMCPSGWTEIPQTPEGQTESAWYLCHAPEGYYPYVRHCDADWEKVTPEMTQGKSP